jgi:hypothetical protein
MTIKRFISQNTYLKGDSDKCRESNFWEKYPLPFPAPELSQGREKL